MRFTSLTHFFPLYVQDKRKWLTFSKQYCFLGNEESFFVQFLLLLYKYKDINAVWVKLSSFHSIQPVEKNLNGRQWITALSLIFIRHSFCLIERSYFFFRSVVPGVEYSDVDPDLVRSFLRDSVRDEGPDDWAEVPLVHPRSLDLCHRHLLPATHLQTTIQGRFQ